MADLPVNIIDIVVLVVILISGIVAFMRGFIHEFLSILGWLGGIALGFFGSFYAKPYITPYIQHELLAQITGGIVIFILAMFILSYISGKIADRIKSSQLNAVDRSIGFLFGLLRGFVIAVLLFMIVEFVWPVDKFPPVLKAAKTVPLLQKSSEGFRNYIGDYLDKSTQTQAARDSLQSKVLEASRQQKSKMQSQEKQSLASKIQAKKQMQEKVQSRQNQTASKPSPPKGQGYGNMDRKDLENLFELAE